MPEKSVAQRKSFLCSKLSLLFHCQRHLCISFVKENIWCVFVCVLVCVWGMTDTVMQLSGVFTVPGVRFSQSPVVSTKRAAPSHFWNDSHFSSLTLSVSSPFLIIADLLMASKAKRCPPLFSSSLFPSLPPSWLVLFCCVTVGNRGEIKRKQIRRAAVKDTPVSRKWTDEI